ncbi:MAG: LysM peptidoglycan-binding domain-containing protein [Candidatus Omnitrophica bacterium]|nr:LysM peptidoglycan-binding domain-containing protein [Candidatus Omnitrophota bacterium]
MKRNDAVLAVVLTFCFLFLASLLSGCIVRTYTVTKERVDQEVAGNEGYIQGNIPAKDVSKDIKKTRKVNVVEIELQSPIKFERGLPKPKTETTQDEELWGNQGYVSGSEGSEETTRIRQRVKEVGEVVLYMIEKGDTLQKISMRFFNTTKKFQKICQDNKDKLKSCEKIYPGQVIKIIK